MADEIAAEGESAPTEGEQAETVDLAAEVEKWKSLSRKNEEQAKANAEAAMKLAEIEDRNKSEVDKLAEKVSAEAQRASNAEAELVRLRAAVKHGLDEEDLEILNTSGTPEEVDARAARLAKIRAASGAPRKPQPDRLQGRESPGITTTAEQFAAAFRDRL